MKKAYYTLKPTRLSNPLSPHASAKLDNISISLDSFQLPKTNNNLIVEGAGGLLVPINEDGDYLSDVIVKLRDGNNPCL